MSHKAHIVRATSNIDGTPIGDVLPPCFGIQGGFSSNRKAIALDCGGASHSQNSWADHAVNEPKLAEYVFDSSDIPDFLTVGCEDLTDDEAKLAAESVATTPSANDGWSWYGSNE